MSTGTRLSAANLVLIGICALIYLLDADARHADLVAAIGLDGGSAAAPARIGLQSSADHLATWPLRRVLDTTTAELVSNLAERFGVLAGDRWADHSKQA